MHRIFSQEQYKRTAKFVFLLIIIVSFFESFFQYTVLGKIKIQFLFVIVIALLSFGLGYDKGKSYWLIWVPFFTFLVYNWITYKFSNHYLIMYLTAMLFPGLSFYAKPDMVKQLLKWIKIISLIFAVGCIFQKLFNSTYISIVPSFFETEAQADILRWDSYGMCSGFAVQPTAAAAAMCIGIVVSWLTLTKKSVRNILVLVLLYWGLILTAKRAFLFISIVVPIFVYYLSNSKSSRVAKLIIIGIVTAVLTYILSSFIGGNNNILLFDRLAQFTESNNLNDVTSGRTDLMACAWEYFKKAPWFGIGFGNFKYILGTSVHNVYVQLLCETGITGFLSFIIPAFICLVSAVYKTSHVDYTDSGKALICKFCLGFQMAFLLYSFSGNPLYDTQWIYLYFLTCSIINDCDIRGEDNEKNRDTNISVR